MAGAIIVESFRSYIAHVLGPTLRRGDIVVMDNVPLHRTQAVREALGKLGVSVPEFPACSFDPPHIAAQRVHGPVPADLGHLEHRRAALSRAVGADLYLLSARRFAGLRRRRRP